MGCGGGEVLQDRGAPASGREGPCSPVRRGNRPCGLRWAALQGRAGTHLEERGFVLAMELLEGLNILRILESFSPALNTWLSTQSTANTC